MPRTVQRDAVDLEGKEPAYSVDDDVRLGGFLGEELEVYQATSNGAYTKLLGEHGSLCWVAHESCDLEARVLKQKLEDRATDVTYGDTLRQYL